MSKLIEMRDPTGAKAFGHIGFCIPALIIGPFAPLLRGHLIGFVAMLATYLGIAAGGAFLFSDAGMETPNWFPSTVGLGLNVLFGATYNSWHRSWLLRRGYAPVSTFDATPDNRPAYVRDIEERRARGTAAPQ